MNKMRLLLGRGRLASALGLGGVLLFSLLTVAGLGQETKLVAPSSPGVPPVGLRYFRLQPSVPDTTFRLLVIPVQFPEDGVLGDYNNQGFGLYVHYSAIPEPGSMLLAGLGSLAAGWYGRRRLRKKAAEAADTLSTSAR